MKKNLYAFLAIILCIPTFLFAQIPPPCDPPGEIVPGENCPSACISCNFSGYSGTTVGWAGDTQPPGWCSNIQNDQWIGFVASSTSATFTITPSDCLNGAGVQAAIFPAGCNNEAPLACNPGCATCGNTPILLQVSGMIPGSTYYLLIDGYSQDECNIDILVTPAQNGLPIGPTPQIAGSNSVCYGSTDTYAVNPVEGAGFYTWSSSHPATLFNGLPGPAILPAPGGNAVDITFPVNVAPGQNVTICVTPSTSCATGTERCKVITMDGTTPPPLIFPPVYVCAENAPYTLPWGEIVNSSGMYSQTYPSAFGCDSIVNQTVTFGLPIVTNITKMICAGDSVLICGLSYKATGSYSRVCTSFQGCDSLVNLNLLVISPVADIIDPDTLLSCNLQQLVLYATPSPGYNSWKDLSTGITTYADSIIVHHAGFYSLQTMGFGFSFCQAYDTIYIGLDSLNAPPSPIITVSGPVTCIAPAILTGTSVFPLTATSWSGPQGFAADTNVVAVTVPGVYTFSATGEYCTDSVRVSVTGDLNPGNVSLMISQVTCSTPGVISVISLLPGITYEWISPTGEIFNTPTITTSLPGTYNLVTTNPANGCTNAIPVVMTEDTAVPILIFSVTHATAGQNDGAINLTPTGGTPPFTYEWTFNGAVFALSEDISNLAPGIYSVILTGSNGCTQSVTIEVMGSVAVQDLNNTAQWIISPNPASTTVQLQWKGNIVAPEANISCFDIAGRLMYKTHLAAGQTPLAIDCNSFSNGSYLLEILPVGQGQKTVLRFEVVK